MLPNFEYTASKIGSLVIVTDSKFLIYLYTVVAALFWVQTCFHAGWKRQSEAWYCRQKDAPKLSSPTLVFKEASRTATAHTQSNIDFFPLRVRVSREPIDTGHVAVGRVDGRSRFTPLGDQILNNKPQSKFERSSMKS